MSTAQALEILELAIGPNDDELEAAIATVRLALVDPEPDPAHYADWLKRHGENGTMRRKPKATRKPKDPLAGLWKTKPSKRDHDDHWQRVQYLASFAETGSAEYVERAKRLDDMPRLAQFDFESPKASMKDDARLTLIGAYMNGAGA